MSAPLTLDSLASAPRWVGWRNQKRGDDLTKVPFDPKTNKPAKADDPRSWADRQTAARWADRYVNGGGGGVGFQLGRINKARAIGGVDLDRCRATDGALAPWAQEVIVQFDTYAEASPSGTGAKLYFQYDPAGLPAIQAAMKTAHGKSWKHGGGRHAPGIELHLGNRYFATTFQRLPDVPDDLRYVSAETLLELITRTGPTFKRAGQDTVNGSDDGDDGEAGQALQPDIEAAARGSPELRAVLTRMITYGTRSEAAMALGGALRRAGFDFPKMCAALRSHEATRDWTIEKGDANDGRELKRIWARTEQSDTSAVDSELIDRPDMTITLLNRRAPPNLPLEVFGPQWAQWIIDTADAACAPADYVASPLLASASALIGHARWAQATPGWVEPPHLWACAVGDSGSSKSPAADALMRDVLPTIEQRMAADFPDRLRDFRAAEEVTKARHEAWAADVRTATKMGNAPPIPPEVGPPEPQAPRLRQSDVTVERVATLLATAAPKGLLVVRDELAGWLLGMTTYNDAGRAFWVECFGGRPYRVERQKSPEPIVVPRLAVAVTGGTQPEKLAELFRESDDGLLSRFIWAWPDPLPFRLGRKAPSSAWATDALDRLRLLELAPGEIPNQGPRPLMVPLTPDATRAMGVFGQHMQQRQQGAGGLMRSAYGKARGLALRLSLVVTMLRWCGEPGMIPPPTQIDEPAFLAACDLVADYFMPMAERVFGDAAATREERNGATLARWILRERVPEVHVRALQRRVRLPGMNTAETIHAAAAVLVEAGWLFAPERGGFQAKARAAYRVNPAIWDEPLS